MGQRSDEIRAAVKNYLDVDAYWRDPENNTPEYPDSHYRAAAQGMIDVCDDGDIPADCREIARKVETFKSEFQNYLQQRYEAGLDDPRRVPQPGEIEDLYPENTMLEARADALAKQLQIAGRGRRSSRWNPLPFSTSRA